MLALISQQCCNDHSKMVLNLPDHLPPSKPIVLVDKMEDMEAAVEHLPMSVVEVAL